LSRKSPEEELASFAASLPRFLRLWLEPVEGETYTDADVRAYFESDRALNAQMTKRYEELLGRCPAKYRAYRERRLRSLGLPPLPRGRPRKDAEAAEALELKAAGKSWQKVGMAQEKSRDAARKLASLRRNAQGK
jgi:hypothetical protein